jgi:UDP-glucose 4-epimerase
MTYGPNPYPLTMPHSLITGGAGFIGSHLTEALLARGYRVSVIDDESTGSVDNLAAVLDNPAFDYTKGDVGDRDLLREKLAEVDEVYHLAATVGVKLIAESPIQSIENNIFPTELLLDELSRRDTPSRPVKLFITSSSEVYGKNPKPQWSEDDDLVLGPTHRVRWSYGAAKAIDEYLALAYWRQRRLAVVVGRLFNVVGPRQSGAYGMVLPRFVEAALAGRPLSVHDDGGQIRCFAHVEDVVGAIVGLMQCPEAPGRVFNIGSDRPVSILQLAEMVIAQVDPSLKIAPISYAEAYGTDFEDCRRRVPDLSRLRETISFQPKHELEDVIREIIELKRG